MGLDEENTRNELQKEKADDASGVDETELSLLKSKHSEDKNHVDKKKLSFRERLKLIKDNITVEPVMACYIMPSVLASLAIQNLNLEKACRVNLNISTEICDALNLRQTENYTEYEEKVQKLIAGIQVWKNVVQTAIPVLLILFVGAWSDKTGHRKACILIPIVGEFCSCLGFIVNTYFFYELPVEVTALTESVFPAITGGWFTNFIGVFSYIGDITTKENRTYRVGVVNMFMSLGYPIGSALSGILLNVIGYYGVFAISASLYLFSLIYGYYYLEDPKKDEKKNGASKERQEMRRTGGGPPPAPPSGSSSDATDWLREIIPSSIDGNMAIYDDDVIYQKPTVFPAKKMEKINEVVEDNTTQESLLPKKPRPEIITMEVVEDYMTEDAHLLNKNSKACTGFLREFFDVKLVMETFKVAFKRGVGNRRLRVSLLLIVVCVVFGPMHGEYTIMYLFARYRFNWDELQFSAWSTYCIITNLLGTLFSITLFSNYLKLDDTMLGIISCSSKIVASFAYAFARNNLEIYLAPLLEILNGTSFIAMRSIATKLVNGEEFGKVNSLFGLAEATMPLVYGPLYSKTYMATMNILPGAVFLLGAALTLPAILIFLWLYFEHKKDFLRTESAKCSPDAEKQLCD